MVLIDRGRGLVYDTKLNITWLQEANYTKTIVIEGQCNTALRNNYYRH